MSKTLASATSLVAAALLVAGCSSAEEPESALPNSAPTQAVPVAHVDAAVVRGGSAYDFPETRSISEAARQASSVLLGEVVAWSDGRSTVESDGSGYEDFSYTAVLSIKVSQAYANSAQRPGQVVHVEVPRGGAIKVNGKSPEGTEPGLATIDELTAAVPAGTRVILLGTPARSSAQLVADTPGSVVRGEGKGIPASAELLAPRVQGLLFEDKTGEFRSGLADDEGDWGWIPSNVPSTQGFSFLAGELQALT